jgi:hypothetical protein
MVRQREQCGPIDLPIGGLYSSPPRRRNRCRPYETRSFDAPPANPAEKSSPPTRVRPRVVAMACGQAVITYIWLGVDLTRTFEETP